MLRIFVVFIPVLLFLFLISVTQVQVVRLPTPTRSPVPAPSPTPTPEPRAMPCPSVTVQAQPGQPVREGQAVSFIANIVGGDPKIVPAAVWTTSAGTIKQGQNSRRIEVDSTGAGSTSEREIKADVWIGGFPPECVLQASAAVKITAPAVKFGEFGELPPDAVSFHIKTLANFFSQSQDSLFLIAYAGRSSERGFAFTWIKRLRDELIAAGVSPKRINAMDGGFREQPLFDFWIVPSGAEPPRPSPTVRREEIVYPKIVPPKKP